ncbi:MAG: 50S ribosomal protein L9 [Spiroplasma sp.]
MKNLGKTNQVVEVSDGYAKNYLIPKKLAVCATNEALTVNQKIKDDKKTLSLEKIKYYQGIKENLESLTLEFYLNTNKGKVTNAISAKQICAYLHYNFGIELDKHKFINFKPIKTIGITEVAVKLYSDIVAKFKVKVSEK